MWKSSATVPHPELQGLLSLQLAMFRLQVTWARSWGTLSSIYLSSFTMASLSAWEIRFNWQIPEETSSNSRSNSLQTEWSVLKMKQDRLTRRHYSSLHPCSTTLVTSRLYPEKFRAVAVMLLIPLASIHPSNSYFPTQTQDSDWQGLDSTSSFNLSCDFDQKKNPCVHYPVFP